MPLTPNPRAPRSHHVLHLAAVCCMAARTLRFGFFSCGVGCWNSFVQLTTSNLSDMGTTNDGVGAQGEEPAQAGEDSQQQSGQGTESVNIEGHNGDTNDDDEENNHNGEHVFYVPEAAFNCANCGAPCNMVCPFGLCFPCCEMTVCGCNEQDHDSAVAGMTTMMTQIVITTAARMKRCLLSAQLLTQQALNLLALLV